MKFFKSRFGQMVLDGRLVPTTPDDADAATGFVPVVAAAA